MPGFREAGLVGVAVALTGGVALIIWTYVSTADKKPKPPKKAKGNLERINEAKEDTVSKAEVIEAQKTPALTEAKPAEKGKQVLVLGLEGAGKTSLLHCFATGSLEQDVSPTQGFNAVSINREDLQIEFLEIGGTENLLAYWKRYMPKAKVLVFVVDSSKSDQFPLAKKHLHELVTSEPLLPLMVLANKQDLPGACSITDLHEALGLVELGDDRRMFLIGTCVKRGEQELNSGVQDARDLVVQMMSEGK
ncbi:ADP-ribosylation factor-like protein 9 [Osmerus mordax]|uniref:ADP-ribosylation factor-like protein 9 n=1 Tax=Osmerus mordax TaxID=8014 RepID=UPI00350FE081